jgi:hypothetical protein
MRRWFLVAVLGLLAAAGGAVWYRLSRARPDPARELFRVTLPTWQTARARPWSTADGPAARDLLRAAQPWPPLAEALRTLDGAWPDDAKVRASVKTANQALRQAPLPYFLDVQSIKDQPIVLSYELRARVPWRIGARAVEVLRLRRLDTMNVELALFGETDHGLPMVLLDRIEASLARELPVVFGHAVAQEGWQRNDFDLAALARLQPLLQAHAGSEIQTAALQLHQRDTLLEAMRARFHGGRVHLNTPDGFVLGEPWFRDMADFARLDRPGGPLILDTDLRGVAHADEPLRSGATAQALAAAVDLMALSTEAHEARHAFDDAEPDVASAQPPLPPELFASMEHSEFQFIGLADKELRAYLGELHDTPAPACLSLAKMLRALFGQGARRNPHFYAAWTILHQLDPASDKKPVNILNDLCDLPDGELRQRAAIAWRKLYLTPLLAGTRGSLDARASGNN